MAITTATLPDGSILTTNTDDTTGKVVWTSVAPPPGSPAAIATANQTALQAKAQAALTSNVNDVTQDQTIQTGAATINGTAGTFTLAQCTTFIKQLAQAVNTLAGNDINTKKELQALVRMVLQQFDSTTGT